MTPTRKAVWLFLFLFLLALAAVQLPQLKVVLLIVCCLFAVTGVVEYFLLRKNPQLEISRSVKPVFPINNWQTVKLSFRNNASRTARLEAFDIVPEGVLYKDLPYLASINAGTELQYSYGIISYRRGEYLFSSIEFWLYSATGLFRRKFRFELTNTVKIYPDYMPVLEYALLAANSRQAMMGIHRVPRRGSGEDFYELREYREGDTIRQIDWRSTARFDKLISREYQAQQDQEIIFLIDASHRMNVPIDNLKQFDYALNALLLTAYIALKQGDAVGVNVFGKKQAVRCRPEKGMKQFDRLLQTLYTVQPGDTAADYLNIAQQVVTQHRKRSTIILITNVRDSDADELVRAVRFMQKLHRVVVASIKENAVYEIYDSTLHSFDQALTKLAAADYIMKRERVLNEIKKRYVNTLDVSASDLPLALANQYLLLKAS